MSLVLLLTMLVVGLGLPGLVLVCNEACCHGRVALSRSCGVATPSNARTEVAATDQCPCCRRAQQARSKLGTLVADAGGCSGCSHHALGCEIATPTPFELPDLPHAAPCWFTHLALAGGQQQHLAAVHPPATGPPRPDPRTGLLATTVLRL